METTQQLVTLTIVAFPVDADEAINLERQISKGVEAAESSIETLVDRTAVGTLRAGENGIFTVGLVFESDDDVAAETLDEIEWTLCDHVYAEMHISFNRIGR